MKTVPAGAFKATCLKLMDRVAETGEPLEVTKRGKPLVRLVPAEAGRGAARRRTVFGAARDSILYLAPDEELLSTGARWDAQR
ncbi:MAG TPA: type II toxin-antitoxin system Phd/YefM family antitoxin [Polyangiaceae bacterium]|jgi:prevent-host-death family protein